MKLLITRATTLLAIAGIASLAWQSHAAEKRSISDVMKDAMKGESSLHKKVALGKGTDDDAAKLLDYFKSLSAETPPVGDAASWKAKTDRLIAAAQGVVDKKSGATGELQMAGNCKACHNEHKSD